MNNATVQNSLGKLLALAWVLLAPSLHAGSHTWSGAVNGNWSTAGNWSAGGVPVIGEASLTITFPGSATRTVMTNNIGALTVTSMNFSGSNYIVRGASTITFGSSLINLLCGGNSNTIESTLSLPGNFAVSVGDNRVMAFHTLTGAGSLIKFGEGEIQLRGVANNTLSGGYTINVGRLVLAKTGGANAVAAPLTIIGTTNFGQLAFVSMAGSEQTAGNVNVTIHATGGLVLNGHTNTINDLTVMAGSVFNDGLLRLNGDLRLSALDGAFPLPDTSPIIRGNLEFIGAFSTVTVSNLTCEIEANIIENGGATDINKAGPGTLWLKGGGNYTGLLNIQQGTVRAEQAASLGSVAGSTLVASGASLLLGAGITTSESFELAGRGVNNQGALQIASGLVQIFGNLSITGDTTVRVPLVGHQLLVNGSISGAGGLRKTGEGHLWVLGLNANTFNGASFVDKGLLTLDKPDNVRAIGSVTVTNGATMVVNSHEQIDNAGVLSLYTGAGFSMLNFDETLGGLNIGGGQILDTGTGTLTLLGNIFSGFPYSANSNPEATIRGRLSLGGATRNVTTTNGYTMMFDCNISDGTGVGGLNLQGGTWLMRSNSFTGPVTVDGFCRVSNNWAFGAPGGGVFFATNTVYFTDIFLYGMTAISGETLTVAAGYRYLTPLGTNAWNGPIVFTNGASLDCDGFGLTDLTLGGPISGSNTFLLSSAGTVRLLGNNTYTGTTLVNSGGTLVIGNPQALGSPGNGTEVWENSTLLLNLPNGGVVPAEPLTLFADTFTVNTNASILLLGSISNTWSGPISIHGDPSRVEVRDGNGTLNLSAAIDGSGGLEKTGPGKLILAGSNANTYTGGTVVTNGTLRLNKPNGVQAVADLSVYFPSWLEWGANEQIADTATLRLIDCDTIFTNRNETITRLVMRDGYLDSGNGALTLLGDIEVPAYGWLFGPYNQLHGSLILGPGTHQIINPNPDPFLLSPILDIYSATSETGGSAGLRISSGVRLRGSNSFTGPVIVDRALVTVFHPQALGSPAQGTVLTNSGALDLAMPSGSVVAGESLVLAPPGPGALYPSVLSMYGWETNTWAGPVTLQGSNTIRSTYGCKLTIDGTMSGPGTLYSDGNGELVLAGSQPNTIPGLIMDEGILRLAKPPGVVALTGDLILNTDNFDNVAPTLILEAPGQFPPQTTARVGIGGTNAFLKLNGYATTIKRLQGFGLVKLGTGLLTISNSAAQYSEFLGTIEGAPGGMSLIKQGIAQQRVGNFNLHGAMSVQGGTVLMDNGSIGALDISAGAVMDMYAPVAHFGSLSGAGGISTAGNGLIYVGGNNLHTVFSGVIFGGSQTNLVKVGTGALTLTGASTDPGKTVVQNGTLLVNGSLAGPVHVQPGAPDNLPTLGGIGTLGNVIVTGNGARISPGATTSVPSYGKLTVTNIALDGGALYLGEIGGTNAGVNLDQIDAKATTTLLNCGADFTAFGAGAVSNRYAVLKSFAAVNGIFSGKSEGSTFFPSAGRSMQITYAGGASGREIVLMDLAAIPPGSFSGIQVLTNGTVQIGGQGTPGVLYDVQANANLTTTNWLVIGSVTGDFNGAFSFIDTNAPSFPMRFYRFLLP